MHIIAKTLIALVALIHGYILVFEMFMWESRGPRAFPSMAAEVFTHPDVKILAANQGLYNGVLAAGLIWALLFIRNTEWKRNVATFFLLCVAVAGIYGAMTASKHIILFQTVPALLALFAIWALRVKE